MKKPVAILSIDVEAPIGGVPAMVGTVYHLLESWGYEPTVHFVPIRLGLTGLERLREIISHLRPWQPQGGELKTILVPSLGLPLWLFYMHPYYLFGPLWGYYGRIFVVSGSAHVALPLALRNIPYVLWIATVYEDELRAKVEASDDWASKALSSWWWKLLLLQERIAWRHASHILTLSRYTKRRVAEIAPEVAGRLQQAFYPVDIDHFQPSPEARSQSPLGQYLLLSARYNDTRKNVGVLFHAFSIVRKRYPDLRLVLVGDKPDGSASKLVQQMQLQGDVILLDALPHDSLELLRLYQGAQLFVLSSTQEGLGIAILEAMACGTPVVATRCGGPEDIIIEGKTGRLVPVGDPSALTNAILEMLEDPQALEEMRKNCVDFVSAECSLQVIEPKLRTAFESIPQRKGSNY